MAITQLKRINGFIKVIFRHDNERWVISTRVKIPEKYWKDDQISASIPNYEVLNEVVMSVYNRVLQASINIRNRNRVPTVTAVRAEYQKMLIDSRKKSKHSESAISEFEFSFERFLESKRVHLKWTSVRLITQVRMIMNQFMESENYDFSPDTFDKVIYDRLVRFMLHSYRTRYNDRKGMKDSTIHARVRWLRAYLRWSYPEQDWDFVKYKAPRQEDIVVIEEDELKYIINYRAAGEYELVKDLFVFMCLTGMRFSDTQRFEPGWISDGLIDFRMLKTGGRAIPPVYKTTKIILDKYSGRLPEIPNAIFNKRIKELFLEMKLNRPVKITSSKGREVKQVVRPLYSVVSAHVARKSFITIALSKGIPIQDVMHMSGHSDYKSLRPYIQLVKSAVLRSARLWEI